MMAMPTDIAKPVLGDLLDGMLVLPGPLAALAVSHVTQDSRDVVPGTLFLARAGLRSHGLDYLDSVIAAGAVAVVAEPGSGWDQARIVSLATGNDLPILILPGLLEHAGVIASRFHGEPSSQLDMVGITGTNGKTSCAWLLVHALQQQHASAMIGTLGIGSPGAFTTATHTTPDAVRLQRTLGEMRDRGCRAVAMEVSSHAMKQGRVAGVAFDIAVFTNLSRDHLDYHETMEAYAAAKARLMACNTLKAAVINVDDAYAGTMMAQLRPSTRLLPVSSRGNPEAQQAGMTASAIEATPEGVKFVLTFDARQVTVRAPLLGRFNVDNLLSVIAVLVMLGDSPEQAAARVATLPPVPGRMELVANELGPVAVIDYAHTPDALRNVLEACRAHTAGTLWCVFGCGGDRDKGKRPEMGAIAESFADSVCLTNDNPRSESETSIIEQILAGMKCPEAVKVQSDRAQAIRQTLALAQPGDLVLIAGKGHEDYQIIGDMVMPFSDREEVEHFFREDRA